MNAITKRHPAGKGIPRVLAHGLDVGFTAQMVSSNWYDRGFRQVRVLGDVCSAPSMTATSFAVEPRVPNGHYRQGYVISVVTPNRKGKGGHDRNSLLVLHSQSKPGVIDVFAKGFRAWEAGTDLNKLFRTREFGDRRVRPDTLDNLLRVSESLEGSCNQEDFMVGSLLRHISHVAELAVAKEHKRKLLAESFD